jgi:hypothetical protein
MPKTAVAGAVSLVVVAAAVRNCCRCRKDVVSLGDGPAALIQRIGRMSNLVVVVVGGGCDGVV